jgi:hypothetical protein
MLTFIQFLTEIWQPEKAMKGWMSPSGKVHIIDHRSRTMDFEHNHNHHPEYLALGGKQGDAIEKAQAHGFVRFGSNVSSLHGYHFFVHYDKTHPQGKATAYKALKYMEPEHNDDVTISGTPGVFKVSKTTGKLYKNKKAIDELSTDSIVPARQAFLQLRDN